MATRTLTIDQGVPVTGNPNVLTSGRHGPVLLFAVPLIEKQEMTL